MSNVKFKTMTEKEFKRIEKKFLEDNIIQEYQEYLSRNKRHFFNKSIVKEFQRYNFYEFEMHRNYLDYSKEEYIEKNYLILKQGFLSNFKRMTQEEIEAFEETENCKLLDIAIKLRLYNLYTAYLSEDYKIALTLKKAKENDIFLGIIDSRDIDKFFGIDYILNFNKEYFIYIHSISGSYTSENYVDIKMNKQMTYQNVNINRTKIFNNENHFIVSNYCNHSTKINKYKQKQYISKQIDNLFENYYFLDSRKAELAKKELNQINELLNSFTQIEDINIIQFK